MVSKSKKQKRSSWKDNLVIAVTGLATGENPQPGVPIIRSIRNAGFEGKIIGLVYDPLEAGIYGPNLADEVYEMPYPSEGPESIIARLEHIRKHTKIDVLIPTLDSEILPYVTLEKKLKTYGINMYLPTREQFMMRDKTKLDKLNEMFNIPTPHMILISEVKQVYEIPNKMNLPVMVKGRFYEAYKAYTVDEIIKYFNKICTDWGLPIIIQKFLPGDEYNIAAIGDGKGGIIGAVPQKKTLITEKGKGFAAVVVKDPALDEFAKHVIKSLKWRGPLELEILKAHNDNNYYLLEMNPRLPAWVRLAEGAGQNLPMALVKLALGKKVPPMPPYKVGQMFIRHNEDIIVPVSTVGELTSTSELHNIRITPVNQRIDSLLNN
ncbi:MAG: biotin carboxylase [Candidatus Hydromicrobium americanum]|nr:MAG: biotin carboxylase [Candidatus Hydromicrobium americanum]